MSSCSPAAARPRARLRVRGPDPPSNSEARRIFLDGRGALGIGEHAHQLVAGIDGTATENKLLGLGSARRRPRGLLRLSEHWRRRWRRFLASRVLIGAGLARLEVVQEPVDHTAEASSSVRDSPTIFEARSLARFPPPRSSGRGGDPPGVSCWRPGGEHALFSASARARASSTIFCRRRGPSRIAAAS